MGLFDGLQNAKMSGSASYFPPGVDAVCEVVRCKAYENFKRESGFLVELVVKKATRGEVKPGETYCFAVKQGNLYFASEVRKIIGACLGLDPFSNLNQDSAEVSAAFQHLGLARVAPDATWPTLGDRCTQADNPLEGTLVRVVTVLRKKKDGGDFTHHTFTTPEGE